MKEIPASQVAIQDAFWSERLQVNAHQAIFHQWEQLEASGCIENFRSAAGESDAMRMGWFFADSDAYKWLEAAVRIQASHPQARLAALIEDFIALLGRAQAPDGYLFTYNQLHFPGQRWVNLQIEHELYCHGHLIEAGVSHYQASGQETLLAIARKAADLLVGEFRGRSPQHTPGHEEIEIALLRLYQVTGETSYLELAGQFIEQRGRSQGFWLSLLRQNYSVSQRARVVRQQQAAYQATHPQASERRGVHHLPPGNAARHPRTASLRWYLSAASGKYFQQHRPIREQDVPVGHAVRFAYLMYAAALLDRLQGTATYLPTLERAWEHMVTRRMYLSGGIGSLPGLEGFGRDYELDPQFAYAETCAALASLFWNWEMALLSGCARYSELFEWQLYNAAAVGMGLDGQSYLYNNPLACRGGILRRPWYAVACCPSNLSRTWADLGRYVFSHDNTAVWVHQYLGCQARLERDRPLSLVLESGLPWQGQVRIQVDPQQAAEFTLHLRLPVWAGGLQARLWDAQNEVWQPLDTAGERAGAAGARLEATAQGYDPRSSRFLAARRTWGPGDRIELDFEMPIVLRRPHPKVRGLRGKAALTRGPLLYCLESVDNPGLDLFRARLDPHSLQAASVPGQELGMDLAEPLTILKCRTTTGKELTFIPYALWANRGESQMTVWVDCPTGLGDLINEQEGILDVQR